jgi:hypothetical protein
MFKGELLLKIFFLNKILFLCLNSYTINTRLSYSIIVKEGNMKVITLFIVGFLFSILLFAACSGTGACVSDVVEFTSFLRVYCYDDFSKDECEDYDAQNINGANWTFYRGDTCDDRGLVEGSNPWP